MLYGIIMDKCKKCGCMIYQGVHGDGFCFDCYNHGTRRSTITCDMFVFDDPKMRTMRWISFIVFLFAVMAYKNTGSSESIFFAFIAAMTFINNISLSQGWRQF
jgi:hypothetical protein